MVKADPIIDIDTYDRAAALRKARSPKKNPPRRISSPNLLTGLLKCACGHHITGGHSKKRTLSLLQVRRPAEQRESCL